MLLRILPFHLGQDRSAIAAAKNNRLAHKRGCRVQKKASPARYVNHELTTKPNEDCCGTPVCPRLKLVKTPAKKIPDKNSQRKINQSQHTQVITELLPALVVNMADTGANRKRTIFFVKHSISDRG